MEVGRGAGSGGEERPSIGAAAIPVPAAGVGDPGTSATPPPAPASRGAIIAGIVLLLIIASSLNVAVIWYETKPPAITGGDDGGGGGGEVTLPVGVVLAQSGLLGSEGVKMVDGARLAEKHLNERGGVKLAGNVTADTLEPDDRRPADELENGWILTAGHRSGSVSGRASRPRVGARYISPLRQRPEVAGEAEPSKDRL